MLLFVLFSMVIKCRDLRKTMVPACNLASPARLERAAFRLGGGCSIQLSYGDVSLLFYAFFDALSRIWHTFFSCGIGWLYAEKGGNRMHSPEETRKGDVDDYIYGDVEPRDSER